MKKILFVVRGFSPDISASGNLIKPLAYELSATNEVYILSFSEYENEIDLSDNLKLITMKKEKPKSIRRKIYEQITCRKYNNYLVKKARKKIEKLHHIYNFDAVFAITYEEIIALSFSSIPKELKNLFLLEKFPNGIRIPILRDIQNTRLAEQKKWVFKQCNYVFMLPVVFDMNKEINSKIILAEHPMVVNKVSDNLELKVIKIIYAGGIDRIQRDPRPIINFFLRLEELNCVDFSLEFYSYGNIQSEVKNMCEKSKRIVIFDAISPKELEDKVKNANFIVTIGNRDSEMVPSKIFDCISTGKPLLHFFQHINDPYKAYLKKYKSYALFDLSEINSVDEIKRLSDFLIKPVQIMRYEDIKDNFLVCTPNYVGEQLLSVIE